MVEIERLNLGMLGKVVPSGYNLWNLIGLLEISSEELEKMASQVQVG